MKIFIDNGHGQFTPGKRSPDGEFREYYYNRIIARRITSKLKEFGYDAELLVPEDDDVPLTGSLTALPRPQKSIFRQ